jgi:sn-glycerol 3-phosphate transport system permease protein
MTHEPRHPGAHRRRRGALVAVLFLLPALAVFALFIFFPTARSVVLSFQGSNLLGQPSGFVGLKHYAQLGSDPAFAQILINTVLFTVLTVAPTLLISLVISLMLNQRLGGIRFFRSAFAIPFSFSVATASVAFSVLYNPANGVLNGILTTIGLPRIEWLTSTPFLALVSVALATVWMNLGYYILIFMAGLGAISEDVVEAARLDGADGVRLQWSVIIPLLGPQFFFLTVTGTLQALQSFGQIHILTKGGPVNGTTTLVYSIYEQAFANNNANYGYASAQAMVLCLVVIIIAALQFGFMQRRVFYK